ncbi:hypothetical protein [Shimia sp. SK013]|uniref:hypothetical protein n=1 Tax=Shimia sp. SK013 TaxID=1389006 RepID=UPI00187D0B96|nr:hypothetical protein [Shimia sp. SK013]
MDQVSRLLFSEAALVNEDELTRLYIKMDYRKAEQLIIAAIDALSEALAAAEVAYNSNNDQYLMAACRNIARASRRLGLDQLASVARDVRIALHQDDDVAAQATLARMLRLGEPSMRALWDIKAIQS